MSPAFIVRPVEGSLWVQDLINQAYLRELFPDLVVQSSVMYMPFEISPDEEMDKLINMVGMLVFPLGMVLQLPIFIYMVILEKETKILEQMKINGLRMYNYWFVNFVFNYLIYMCAAAAYYGFGRYVFELQLFTITGVEIMMTLLGVWGFT